MSTNAFNTGRERQIDREFAHENTMAKINELAKNNENGNRTTKKVGTLFKYNLIFTIMLINVFHNTRV